MFALWLGLEGIGVYSQLNNLNSLIIFFGTVGLPLGLVRYISQWEKEGRWEEIYAILKQASIIILVISLLLICFALLFSSAISSMILGTNVYSLLVILTTLSFPFSAFISICDSYLRGLKKFKYYVKLSIMISLMSTIISFILVFELKMLGLAMSFLVSSLTCLLIYIYFLLHYRFVDFYKFLSSSVRNNLAFKYVMKIGISSLLVGILNQMTILIVRSIIIKHFGLSSNGLYQSVFSISNNYFNVFFMSIGIYSLPIISELKSMELVNLEINSMFKFVCFLILPLISLVYVFRDFLIRVLYSSDFVNSEELFFFNLLGDYFKAFSWVMGMWLIPTLKIKAWVFFEVIFNTVFLSLFYLLLSQNILGLNSVTISYFVAYLLHFIVNLVFLRFKGNFRFSIGNLRIFIVSTISLLTIFLISYSDIGLGYLFLIPILLICYAFNMTKQDLFVLKHFLQLKYARFRSN